ncbi:MAG: hypothetical protein C4291_09135 [Candidatus Dadabacteria bacterium]
MRSLLVGDYDFTEKVKIGQPGSGEELICISYVSPRTEMVRCFSILMDVISCGEPPEKSTGLS